MNTLDSYDYLSADSWTLKYLVEHRVAEKDVHAVDIQNGLFALYYGSVFFELCLVA